MRENQWTRRCQRQLNSNIGCFEIKSENLDSIAAKLLNSNIGCFEIINPHLLHTNLWLNSNIGCFEINEIKVPMNTKNMLNSNIGCFEIVIRRYEPETTAVKQ